MHRAISRRDFLNGVGVAIGASLLPGCSRTGQPSPESPASYYPPAETGMRGAHPGSFEAAHALVQGQQWSAERIEEHYDLVVVGAGISGLSAAYIHRRDVDQTARILILDNHDDFGGHAKRNEFELDGRTYVGYGGTMLMESPDTYPEIAKDVVRELGIDTQRRADFYHDELIAAHGLGRVSFFDKETFGEDFLATGEYGVTDSIDRAPLSDAAKIELKRLFSSEHDILAEIPPAEREAVLESNSWRELLENYATVGEEALAFLQKWPHSVWGIGADELPAWVAQDDGYPGFPHDVAEDAWRINGFFFPDGNASIARLLVRKLIPEVAPGTSMESVVAARFDYQRLDQPDNSTRIRLNSTVVELRHASGGPQGPVDITYVNDGQGRTVSADKVIWAGYHAMLPYVCPDVPRRQADAQHASVRSPLTYTNVLIRNWRSLADLGIQRIYSPGSFFQTLLLMHPVSIGDYAFSTSPDDPVILHLQHIPLAPGVPAAEQFRAGRQALLETPFETFERNARDQLDRMLGPGGFNAAEDIAGITVNRWPHGYAYSVDVESGDIAWWPEYWPHERRPWIDACQRIGNIAIAGTDSSSNAMTESAIEEAYRAVHELKEPV